MKDFNEILRHVNAIDEIDERRQSGGVERRRAIGALACHIADELIAGRPVPAFADAERFTRIDGLATTLANELVGQHNDAIAHRYHLAERMEADGGENGAKAAAILRGMNLVAGPFAEEDEEDAPGTLRAKPGAFDGPYTLGYITPFTWSGQVAERRGNQSTRLAIRTRYDEEPFWIDLGKVSETDLAKLRDAMIQPAGRVDLFRTGLPPYTFYAGPAVAESLEEDQRLKKTAGKFGGVLRPTSECAIISDDMGTSTYTMVGDVNESGRIEWRGGVDVQGQASDEAETPARIPMDEAHRVKVQFTVCGTPFTAFADDVQIDDANWAAIKRARKWQKEIRVLLGQEG